MLAPACSRHDTTPRPCCRRFWPRWGWCSAFQRCMPSCMPSRSGLLCRLVPPARLFRALLLFQERLLRGQVVRPDRGPG